MFPDGGDFQKELTNTHACRVHWANDKGTQKPLPWNWSVSFLEHKIYIYYPPFYTNANDRNLFALRFVSLTKPATRRIIHQLAPVTLRVCSRPPCIGSVIFYYFLN